jgi:hypothetical protein
MFDIDDEKVDCCRSDVLQNNFAQFDYGRLCTLELHSGYDLGGIHHVAFLHVVANLVPPTSKDQTRVIVSSSSAWAIPSSNSCHHRAILLKPQNDQRRQRS